MEIERNSLAAAGISQKAAETIVHAIRPGTRKAYEAKWTSFSALKGEKILLHHL
jgi:hypothetical protein